MDKSFFTYKGFPLVRHEDVIYYGNMSDDYVVMLKILNKKKAPYLCRLKYRCRQI